MTKLPYVRRDFSAHDFDRMSLSFVRTCAPTILIWRDNKPQTLHDYIEERQQKNRDEAK